MVTDGEGEVQIRSKLNTIQLHLCLAEKDMDETQCGCKTNMHKNRPTNRQMGTDRQTSIPAGSHWSRA